jgi:hypothetical protein
MRRKKILAVMKAAICGALFLDLPILIDNGAYLIWGHKGGGDFWHNLFEGIGFLISIPSIWLASVAGIQGGVNAYVVNALLGICVFGGMAFIWQFIVKSDNENKS